MNPKAAQDARTFLKDELEKGSPISKVAARIWAGCVSGEEHHSLMTERIFQANQLPANRIDTLKERSLAGDDEATREALGLVIGTLHTGIQSTQSNS